MKYDQSSKTQFAAYDFKGNLLSLTKQLCQDYKQTIDWNRSPALETEIFAQSFTYDAMNRPIEITKPDNSLIAHSYNKAGLLETVKARLRGAVSWTDFVRDINYNEKGQRTEIYFANNSKTKYEYDDKTFRLTRLLTTRNSGQDVLQDLNYEYDPVGNITRLRDDAQQTFYFDNAVIAPESRFTYDALYRLTEATGREMKALAMPTHNDFANNIALPNPASNALQNYTQQYTYDALGNIQRMQSKGYWTRDYYYDLATNRLLNHDGRTDVYSYDEHGNTTAMPHLTSMQWDYKDQLREVDLGGGGTTYYVYDASGERARKVIEKAGGIVEQRIYLGGWEVYRKTISGNLNFERETLRIMDDRKAIAQIETKTVEGGREVPPLPNIRYQYDNHLGSACLELDENAAIISYEEYHPFGTTSYRSGRTETEVSLKRYKYVGKERDEETGLYFYGARYYAGWLAIFVSVDALQHKYPHYTPYQYAGNKPVTFIDLDGLEEAKNEEIVHTVKQGDTPEGISKKYGTNAWELAKMNKGAQEGGGFFSDTGSGDYQKYWLEGAGTRWQLQPGDELVVGIRQISNVADSNQDIQLDRMLKELNVTKSELDSIFSDISQNVPQLISQSQEVQEALKDKHALTLTFTLKSYGINSDYVDAGGSVKASFSTTGEMRLFHSAEAGMSIAGLSVAGIENQTGVSYNDGETKAYSETNVTAMGWRGSAHQTLGDSDASYNFDIAISYSRSRFELTYSLQISGIADVQTEFGKTGAAAGFARSNAYRRMAGSRIYKSTHNLNKEYKHTSIISR